MPPQDLSSEKEHIFRLRHPAPTNSSLAHHSRRTEASDELDSDPTKHSDSDELDDWETREPGLYFGCQFICADCLHDHDDYEIARPRSEVDRVETMALDLSNNEDSDYDCDYALEPMELYEEEEQELHPLRIASSQCICADCRRFDELQAGNGVTPTRRPRIRTYRSERITAKLQAGSTARTRSAFVFAFGEQQQHAAATTERTIDQDKPCYFHPEVGDGQRPLTAMHKRHKSSVTGDDEYGGGKQGRTSSSSSSRPTKHTKNDHLDLDQVAVWWPDDGHNTSNIRSTIGLPARTSELKPESDCPIAIAPTPCPHLSTNEGTMNLLRQHLADKDAYIGSLQSHNAALTERLKKAECYATYATRLENENTELKRLREGEGILNAALSGRLREAEGQTVRLQEELVEAEAKAEGECRSEDALDLRKMTVDQEASVEDHERLLGKVEALEGMKGLWEMLSKGVVVGRAGIL